jgi:hypothetical protein
MMNAKSLRRRWIKPRSEAHGKTAYIYIWVDALRYEMARELVQTLGAERDITLTPALAAVPTITEIGMAALLPGAQHATLVTAGRVSGCTYEVLWCNGILRA